MAVVWIKSPYPGVRYHEHPARRAPKAKYRDRYIQIRYRSAGKNLEEFLGWESLTGITLKGAADLLAKLKAANVTGEGDRSLAEARARRDAETEAKRQAEAQAQEAVEVAKRENVTLQEVFDQAYLPTVAPGRTRRTNDSERALFRLWVGPAVGTIPLRDIRALDLERMKRTMLSGEGAKGQAEQGTAPDGRRKKTMCPTTVRNALALVRHVFRFARLHGITEVAPPTEGVRAPKYDPRRVRALTREEADALVEELRPTSPDTARHAILSLDCGLRWGEIAALTWGDVDAARGTLTLRNTKSSKTRIIPMTARALGELEALERGARGELVFPPVEANASRGGLKNKVRHQVSDAFGRAVDRLGFNLGVEDRRQLVVFHTLRHTFATWHAEAGTPLPTLQFLLGHSSLAMVSRYAHATTEAARAAVAAVEAKSRGEGGKVVPLKGRR